MRQPPSFSLDDRPGRADLPCQVPALGEPSGQTARENTGIPIHGNLYEYKAECTITADLDNTPHNNATAEVIPNP